MGGDSTQAAAKRELVLSAELAGILERLGSKAQSWQVRMEKLRNGRLLGRFFAASQNSGDTISNYEAQI